MSSIYAGEVFAMARQYFDTAADHLELPADMRERIFLPKRALTVSCPIQFDDGTHRDVRLEADAWVRNPTVRVLVEAGRTVVSAEMDPDHRIPGKGRTNNRLKGM